MISKYRNLLAILLLFRLFIGVSFSAEQTPKENSTAEFLLEKAIGFTQSNPDSSFLFAKRALQKANNSNDFFVLLRSHHQLGFIYYEKNNFDDAAHHFEISLRLAQEHDYPYEQALSLNRLGNVNQLQTKYLKALDYYLRALELNKSINNKAEVARTLVNLANVYSTIGQYQRSIEHFLEAMDIHESIGEREGLAWTSLGIARLFKRLDLLERSMQYAQAALDYYRQIEMTTGKSVGVTLSLSELGSIYHKMGRFDKALEYANMVLDINIKSRNIHGQAANNISLGVIFLDQGNNDLARTHLLEALRLKQSVGDSIDLALLYRRLGQVEIRNRNYQKAKSHLMQSKDFANKHRLIPDLSEAYLSLSSVYSLLGNHIAALEAYKTHSMYKDSLNSNDIARLEMQYEFEKREKEQELLSRQREALQQARLERQRVVLVFFVIAFLLAGSLAAFIFYGYREKKRINFILVQQNNEITRQKREIESQKEEIEQQRDFVTRQRDQIAEQQRLITDSITYASRIQGAVLPSRESLKNLPWESFVFYKPKNIVSGDFYWATELDSNRVLLAAADCTGHGVPGAFMSMLGITLLREIAGKQIGLKPAEILMKLREMVLISLNQQSGNVDQADGMDMSIAIINRESYQMDFAGAYLPIIIARKGNSDAVEEKSIRIINENGCTLIELKGNKMPIGYHILGDTPFQNQTIQLQRDDMLYLFSDGYIDQFGGEKNMKFLLNNFRKLLATVYHLELEKQKDILISTIEEFMGDKKQVDDMLVFGIRIS